MIVSILFVRSNEACKSGYIYTTLFTQDLVPQSWLCHPHLLWLGTAGPWQLSHWSSLLLKTPNSLLQAFQCSKTDACVCVSLKSFSLPKPKRGSYSYLDISKCSLSFPGQSSKSGLLSLKFKKNLSSRCLCFPDCDLFLSFLFFLSFYALINHSLDFHALFPSSGNSFVMLSLRTLGLLAVSWNSLFTGLAYLQVPHSKAWMCRR